ncbi:MAG TPA: SRPBCC family protein [Methylococcus sp.]|nr:SRPBCC family protein [Methylococcus sp.]
MITLLVLIGIPVVLLVVAIVVGRRLPKTHQAASRIRLPLPPEKIWEIITDIDAFPSWRPGLRGIERAPDIEGKPSWFEVCGKKAKVQFRVVEMRPPHRLVTSLVGDQLPLKGSWIYELEQDEAGQTVLTITECDRIFHPVFRFFVRYVLAYHGVMDVFLLALARAIGSPARPEHLSTPLQSAEIDAEPA